ncbi:MAG: ATP synthase subunit delta [Alphaproteobacteria bacterium ADurb.BinA280]|jgi:F-type H+-transporting ATPase subunit delta|nr:MAG: ATP synthase subunit delta [Alphaproteobacteria bacterium ADurb.BinA280]
MSNVATLARPYARAAFALASKASALASWSQSLQFSSAASLDARVAPLIGHPRLAADELVGVLAAPGCSEDQLQFLVVLADNRRLVLLPEIAAQFEGLRAEAERTVRVTVTSATAMDAADSAALLDALRRRFGTEVVMQQQVDAELIGGAIIDAGDLVIDGSVRGKLQRMERALSH